MHFGLLTSLLGTIISVASLTLLAKREHAVEKGKTLSELGSRNSQTLREFRIILWMCGLLFIVAMHWSILPGLGYPTLLTIVWLITIACELMLGLIPAQDDTLTGKIHNAIAFTMGSGMLLMTLLFSLSLSGYYQFAEMILFGFMFVLGIQIMKRNEHFLYYELPYIFLSHLSIVVAALSIT